jgi:hypothetical protein
MGNVVPRQQSAVLHAVDRIIAAAMAGWEHRKAFEAAMLMGSPGGLAKQPTNGGRWILNSLPDSSSKANTMNFWG